MFIPIISAILLACSSNIRTLEVCLSPGCIADGADATLAKLIALSPPGVRVVSGSCVSGCGAGPIVVGKEEEEIRGGRKREKKTIHKRVVAGVGDAVLELLDPTTEEDNDEDSIVRVDPNLVRGYDLVQEAHAAVSASDFEKARSLFAEGIGMAREAAIDMQLLRDNENKQSDDASETKNAVAPGLDWLVSAYRSESELMLAMRDFEGARAAAMNACEMSKDLDASSFECFAEVCKSCGDVSGELEALRTVFQLEPQSTTTGLPRDVQNRRRLLGFRLAKLENEVN
mmetsp:Transcript_49707/g.73911  ORF Transcript_49707/g.73911 Transcript_49707/m.73911 type:complete len:286 (+) Transcript_49707:116-973(+)|eukprot:CAMPEP_0195540918 /NCGR_PEP_ID=MMETSP0794_2-20130614/50819_1 /TAXON_ID=515487 /ORGANISM="Stephanopyxis turris, Strain CCMP 815" /LENGTH=285 /DNA_ID=CAMNT_0040674997 /DNA_START=116 /DNA_END=973 /DNA_ORIENTATION=+